MILFIITSILPIFLLIVTIFLSIKARNAAKDKDTKRERTIAIISAVCSLLSLGIIHVPAPTIYPLDNEVRVYEGKAEVIIESDDSIPFLHTYYSLDGSDPKNGSIYKGSFTITKSTTVVAKNRFLHFWWSEPFKSTYKFGDAQNVIVNNSDLLLSDDFISVDALLKFIIGLIFGILCIKIAIGFIKDFFKSLFP